VIPAIGSVLSIIGLYGMATMPDGDGAMIAGLGAWSIWALGAVATLVGSILFGVATIRAAVLSRRGAIALSGSSLFVMLLGTGVLGTADSPIGGATLIVTLSVFTGSWVLLGVSALRRGPIRAIVRA
jgi:hypothetical protein